MPWRAFPNRLNALKQGYFSRFAIRHRARAVQRISTI
jgi:hypothetical protein